MRIVIVEQRSVRERRCRVRDGCWTVESPRSAVNRCAHDVTCIRKRRGTGGARRDRRVAASKTHRAWREARHASRIVARGRRARRLSRRSLDKVPGELDGRARPTATVERGVAVAERGIQRARRGIMWPVGEIGPTVHQSLASCSACRTLARQVRRGGWLVSREHHYNDGRSGSTLWRRPESASREADKPKRFIASC